MEKLFIKNRKNQKIAVLVERAKTPHGLVFVMHGMGDSKDSDHIKTFVKCFFDNNYTVVRFDATGSFGESDGKFENANILTYYEDLEDVLNWSKSRDFYQEPFILCGHSLGATSSVFYAENNPNLIKAVFSASAVINAELSKKNYSLEELYNWEKTGWITEDWDGFEAKFKWSYMQAKEKFDLLEMANKLNVPTFLVVGELDNNTPPKNQQILFDKLPSRKELYVIKNAPHTFKDKEHLNEVYKVLDEWIKSIN